MLDFSSSLSSPVVAFSFTSVVVVVVVVEGDETGDEAGDDDSAWIFSPTFSSNDEDALFIVDFLLLLAVASLANKNADEPKELLLSLLLLSALIFIDIIVVVALFPPPFLLRLAAAVVAAAAVPDPFCLPKEEEDVVASGLTFVANARSTKANMLFFFLPSYRNACARARVCISRDALLLNEAEITSTSLFFFLSFLTTRTKKGERARENHKRRKARCLRYDEYLS
jgi:hypothetical protein